MTVSITVDSSMDESNLARFTWLAASGRWADSMGPLARTALKNAAPKAKGPGGGRLRDSIRYERKTGATSVSMVFTANTPYAGYVIKGTPPHLIRPRAAKALRWATQGGSRFAMIVHHPGTKPNDFPERALRPMEDLLQTKFTEILRESLEG